MFARVERGAVRKHVAAVVALDHPDTAAYIAGQASVGDGMDIPGPHPIARPEFRRRRRRTAKPAAHHDARDVLEPEAAALQRFWRREGMPVLHLVRRNIPLRDQQILKAEKPLLVIGTAKIDMRR